MLLELRVGPVLVAGDDEFVTELLEVTPEAEFTRDAAYEFSRFEAKPLGRGRRLAIRIGFDCGNAISRIARRIACLRIGVENTKDICHFRTRLVALAEGCRARPGVGDTSSRVPHIRYPAFGDVGTPLVAPTHTLV